MPKLKVTVTDQDSTVESTLIPGFTPKVISVEISGKQGPQGPQGLEGPQGPQGLTGLKGDKGDTGQQGIQGAKGDTGNTGQQGIQGIKGDTGNTGSTGLQGEIGPKGDKGDQGNPGVKGDTGNDGQQGLKGDTGNTGLKGDQGEQGIQGLKGDKGDTGEQGEQGEQGIPGTIENLEFSDLPNINQLQFLGRSSSGTGQVEVVDFGPDFTISDDGKLANQSLVIENLDEKTTPVSDDLILIADSESGNDKKKVKISNLPGGDGGGSSSLSGFQQTSWDYLLNYIEDANGVLEKTSSTGFDCGASTLETFKTGVVRFNRRYGGSRFRGVALDVIGSYIPDYKYHIVTYSDQYEIHKNGSYAGTAGTILSNAVYYDMLFQPNEDGVNKDILIFMNNTLIYYEETGILVDTDLFINVITDAQFSNIGLPLLFKWS